MQTTYDKCLWCSDVQLYHKIDESQSENVESDVLKGGGRTPPLAAQYPRQRDDHPGIAAEADDEELKEFMSSSALTAA
jgi:hypothetical protein